MRGNVVIARNYVVISMTCMLAVLFQLARQLPSPFPYLIGFVGCLTVGPQYGPQLVQRLGQRGFACVRRTLFTIALCIGCLATIRHAVPRLITLLQRLAITTVRQRASSPTTKRAIQSSSQIAGESYHRRRFHTARTHKRHSHANRQCSPQEVHLRHSAAASASGTTSWS